MTGVVGALGIALLLIGAPGLLRNLPQAVLGAVVIAACVGLVEVSGVVRLYRLRRGEFAISGPCASSASRSSASRRGSSSPSASPCSPSSGARGGRTTPSSASSTGSRGTTTSRAIPTPGASPASSCFRWDAPLFFANAATFRDHVLRAVAEAPTPTRWVVVAAEPVTDVDITAADALAALDETLHAAGVELCFAEMKGPVKDRLKTYGLFTQLGTENFFRTLEQAVKAYHARFDDEVTTCSS